MNTDLLNELIEYFENRADADGDSQGLYPNKEMQILAQLREEQKSIDEIPITSNEAFNKWLMNGKRIFFIDEVRKWIRLYDKEEISLSKLVEIFNYRYWESEALSEKQDEKTFEFCDLEVWGSNSGDTGIVYNHPNHGDESVYLRHKPTGKTGYVKLNTLQRKSVKLVCSLDAQQCQQECEHKSDRTNCPFTQPKENHTQPQAEGLNEDELWDDVTNTVYKFGVFSTAASNELKSKYTIKRK